MPSIISGEGLGLFNNQLAGLSGQASLGQAGTGIAVNTATGNLVVQQSDQLLFGVGSDSAIIRTYNSQGQFNDDNGDNFRFNFNQRLFNLTGSVNTAGSTITRIAGDGSETLFTYQDSGDYAGLYLSSDGEGAHDTLSFDAGSQQWTYIEGSSQRQEQYDWASGLGKMIALSDTDGNTTSFAYHANGFINQITDASGQVIDIVYVGNNATEVRTTSNGNTETLVSYQYDGSNRLIQAIIDLTPDNTTDSQIYTTSYTYDGASNRIASISQSDGATVGFTYDASGRIATVTDGEGNVTTWDYSGGASGASSEVVASDDINTTAMDTTASGNVITDGVADADANAGTGSVNSTALTLDFNAGNDPAGDDVWTSTGSNTGFEWNFGANTSPVSVSSQYAGITSAYQFDGSNMAILNDEVGNNESLDDLPGNPSNDSASFEIWVRAADLADSDVIFETGGGGNGTAIWLDGTLVHFGIGNSSGSSSQSFDLASIGIDPSKEFIQIVGVVNDDADIELYINGALAMVDTNSLLSDWAGGNRAALAGIGGGITSVAGSPSNFEGEIAIFRFYEQALSAADVAVNFQAIAGMSVTAVNGNALSLNTPIALANGQLLMAADGSYQYTPNAGFIGTETFNYTITDALGNSDTATVTIIVFDEIYATNDVNIATVDTATSGNVITNGVADADANASTGSVNGTALTLDFNAGNDPAGDGVWTSTGSNTGFEWNFGANTSPVSVSSQYAGITSAYQFDGSNMATLNDEVGNNESLDDLPGNPSNDSASFEMWVRAADLADSDVIFETGGGGNGTAIWLDGTVVHFGIGNSSGSSSQSFDLARIGIDPTQDFIQIVGVINDDANVELYINGALAMVDTNGLISNWAGGNRAALAGIGGGITSVAGSPSNFEGEIAIFRFYEQALSAADVAVNFQAIAGMSVTAVNGNALSLNTPIALANGQLLMAADGSYQYTPNAGFIGTETFNYTITDSQGNSDTATVAILVNSGVDANDNINTTLVDTTANGNVITDGVADADANAGTGSVNGTALTLDFNANNDPAGDDVWTSTGSNTGFEWNFDANTSPVSVSSQYAGITSAYQFDGSNMAILNDEVGNNESLDDLPGNPSNDSASFEMWVRASDLADADVLFETGGGGNGTAIWLDGTLVYFGIGNSSGSSSQSFDLASIGVDPSKEFIQIVGVVNDDADIELYINGALAMVDTNSLLSDWAGGNRAALAGIGGGITSVAGSPSNFEGEIAIFRFYEQALSAADVAANFQAVAGMSVTAINGNALSLNTPIALANGQLLMAADGSYQYTPNAGFTGTETFNYTLTDSQGNSDTANVSITVYDNGSGVSALSDETTITDPLGNIMTYRSDSEGRVTEMISPLVNGSPITTSFSYDAEDNLLSTTDGNGNTTRYEYDARGNRVLEQDALGNTVTRTFGSTGEVLTGTRYLTPDPDGAGSAQPSDAITTRFVYDAEQHLRFSIDEIGQVSEFRYDTDGNLVTAITYVTGTYSDSLDTEAALSAWAASQDQTQIQRVDSAYDFRSQLSLVTTYAATDISGTGIVDGSESVARFIYDQYGRLLETITPNGVATTDPNDYRTSNTYDGLGRLLTTTDALGRTSTISYNDAAQSVVTQAANGLVSTSVFDNSGRLLSTSQSEAAIPLGTTFYQYDADGQLLSVTDALGNKTYSLYDNSGRAIASIDREGALTQTFYDSANRVVQTTTYAQILNDQQISTLEAAALAIGGDVEAELSSITAAIANIDDRSRFQLYNAANQLVYRIDNIFDPAHVEADLDVVVGAVTQFFYDGAGRVTDTIAYATALTTPVTASTQVGDINVTADAADRHSRIFYGDSNQVIATLDAEGFLAENVYDAVGQLVETIAFADVTEITLRASGDLAALLTSITADANNDQHSHLLYDGKGQLIAILDAENFLTEMRYDANGNEIENIAYANQSVPYTGQSLALLRPVANSNDEVVISTYTQLDQVESVTSRADTVVTTVTTFVYDEVGQLISSSAAVNGSEIRTTQTRYDVQGRVLAELTGEGSAALEALVNPTPSEIDAIWAQYAISHSYDFNGRRTSTTDQNGNTHYFYYDDKGRLTHVINAEGDVTETQYNAFGQIKTAIIYTASIDTTGLVGGVITTVLQDRLTAASDPVTDNNFETRYNLRGAIRKVIDGESFVNRTTHNIFGQVDSTTVDFGGTDPSITRFSNDRLGQTLTVVDDWGDATHLNRNAQSFQYDAFGRVQVGTNANGVDTQFIYDRLGRVVQTTQASNTANSIQISNTYDAFGRALTQTDSNGNTTTFVYDDANYRVTLTTEEGISTTTVNNRHGEVVQVIDGNGNITEFNYDRNGNLIQTISALGTAAEIVETSNFDDANRLIETTDARGTVVAFVYDAANRVITRTVDPAGLNISNQLRYDGQGRTVYSVDGNGVVIETQYDRRGQVVATIIDPNVYPAEFTRPANLGPTLNIRTEYTYDGRGRNLTLVEAAGTPRGNDDDVSVRQAQSARATSSQPRWLESNSALSIRR